MRKSYVDGRWGQVHLREMGDGDPLLLLHQSPLSGCMFEAALPFLADAGFRAVAADTAGYGASDAAPEPPSIQDHGAATGDVLDALGWDRCFLIGHHTGAAIAASFAARNAGRVRALVLHGVPLLTEEELAFYASYEFKPLLPKEDGSHFLTAWENRLKSTPGWTDLRLMHRYTVEMLGVNETYHLGFAAALSHDMTDDLMALAVPTLVSTNTGEDLYEASKRAAALRDDFHYDELEGGTHDIVDEQPRAWAAMVSRFLRAC